MKTVLRSLLTLTLCLWLMSPALAQMPAGHWEGNGLISSLTLSKGWKEGSIQLSEPGSLGIQAFADDRERLNAINYNIPIKMLISVDEIVNKTEAVILSCEEFGYNIVMRYNPHTEEFTAVWFDRKDVEIPTAQYTLVKDN